MATHKSELRNQYLKKRDSLDPIQRVEYSRSILQYLTELDTFQNSQTVMSFLSFRSEVDTWPIAKHCLELNKDLVLPAINWDNKELVAAQIKSLETDLIKARFQLLEPDLTFCKQVKRQAINLVLVPGAVWNNKGFRIGYGGGFYDRFLKNRPSTLTTIGLAFECQTQVDFDAEDWDEPVDYILTEKGLFECER